MSETSDCTRFTVVKAFIDPYFATESESKPKQEESSCETENESLHLELGHWLQLIVMGIILMGKSLVLQVMTIKLM